MLAFTVQSDMIINQMDVVTTFLNGVWKKKFTCNNLRAMFRLIQNT